METQSMKNMDNIYGTLCRKSYLALPDRGTHAGIVSVHRVAWYLQPNS